MRREIDEIVATPLRQSRKNSEPGGLALADGIVQSMLLHARSGSGERRKVALNELVVEVLSLAYHGARAQDPNLNLTPRAADDRRCADRSRNRGDQRLLAEFGFARSGRLRCDADRQVAIPPRPQKRILPCSGLRK
jgi:hypothetical protein